MQPAGRRTSGPRTALPVGKRSFVVDSQRYDRTVLALFDRTIHPGAAGWYLPMRTTAVDDRRHSGGNDRSHRLVRFRAAARTGILVYDPAQRGKGYGAEALALLEEYARTVLRLRQLWCNVLADNVPSLTLFERAGFRRVGVKKEWIRTPEGYKDEVLLQKLL